MGMKRVTDARCVLSALMQEAEEDRRPFPLFEENKEKKIAFGVDEDGEDGVRVDEYATFYVWQVKGKGNNQKFEDFPANQSPTMAASTTASP